MSFGLQYCRPNDMVNVFDAFDGSQNLSPIDAVAGAKRHV
jgi:hypothetical protein